MKTWVLVYSTDSSGTLLYCYGVSMFGCISFRASLLFFASYLALFHSVKLLMNKGVDFIIKQGVSSTLFATVDRKLICLCFVEDVQQARHLCVYKDAHKGFGCFSYLK